MWSISVLSGVAFLASLAACIPRSPLERIGNSNYYQIDHLPKRDPEQASGRTSSRETIYPASPSNTAPLETRTTRQTIYPSTASYTESQQTRPTSRTHRDPPPASTTYVTIYDPNKPEHEIHHRSENEYTTIYVSIGDPTTYVQPIYVQPTSPVPPIVVTQAPDPSTYTTIYVYPDTTSSTRTFYSTVTTYVTQSQPVVTITSTVYQTYVPPATTGQPGPSSVPTPGVNPWADACPVPSIFVINNFAFGSGGASLSISYNGGTFKCPNTATNEVMYNGVNDMYCDDDGLVRVITDGATWIWVSEWSWCNAVPAASGSMPTLEASTNYTKFGAEALKCVTTNGKIKCTQSTPNFTIPVTKYGLGGSIGFEPLDINGNYLPNCPSVTSTQPIVTNTASCANTKTKTSGLATVTITA